MTHSCGSTRSSRSAYAEWERNEADVFRHIKETSKRPKINTILKDRRGGVTRSMSLKMLRERIEAGDESLPKYDWGGCGCALD